MNTKLHKDGFAADTVTHGCTASVLVLSGAKPKKKIMNTFVLSVINYFHLLMYVSCSSLWMLLGWAVHLGMSASR